MFEYGGGVNRGQNQKGWSPEFFQNTLNILKLLKNLGYGHGILLDFAPDCQEVIFDLNHLEVSELEKLFPPESVYGNIILFKDYQTNQNQLSQICEPYYRVNVLERLVNTLVSRH